MVLTGAGKEKKMKNIVPLHERLRGLDADERCAVEVLSSVGIGDVDCPRACGECIAKAFEAMADEIEQNYELRDDAREQGEDACEQKYLGTDADGCPIYVGDEVYVAPEHARDCDMGYLPLNKKAGLSGYGYGEKRVAGKGSKGVDLKSTSKDDGVWCPASWLTHTPPDTQERIDKGKWMTAVGYWGCAGILCDRCPVAEDGVKPKVRYGVASCSIAQGMDIARRQAELDALLGGDA